MDSSQPLVCASLHLPPDPQPFLRIHQVALLVFLPNLDRLRRDVESTQETNPEATESFFKTREALRGELHKVFLVLQFGQELANRYIKLLEVLEEKKQTQEALYEVHLGAAGAVECAKDGHKAMSVFRKEFEEAVQRVATSTSAKYKRGSTSSLTSSQNMKAVSEILTAVDECKGLLQQCHDQFAELSKQTGNKNSIDSDPPSEEETQVMRGKWQTFLDTIMGVWRQGFEIANEIVMPIHYRPQSAQGSREARQHVPFWRAIFRRQDKRDLVRSDNNMEAPREPTNSDTLAVTPGDSHEIRTSVINPVDTTEGPEDTATPNAAPSNGQTANSSKVLIWRKVFRRTSGSVPQDISRGVEASNDAPDATAPPPKVTLWRKFFRWVTCVSSTPLR